jgi:hypothetical protein
MPSVFGPSLSPLAPSPASHFGGDPPPVVTTTDDNNPQGEDEIVTWARNAAATLKRERQAVTTRMTEAVSLSRGETGSIWKSRPPWKIGTRLNKCFTVPNKWASILSDNEQVVVYSSHRTQQQRTAQVLTAAYAKAYADYGWGRVRRNAIFDSRVQGKSYLSLRPDIFSKDKNRPNLFEIPGLQVWVDRNATGIDDAEVILYEYRQSYGKVIFRFPDTKDHLERKYQNLYDPQDFDGGSVASPPATLNMPTGATINNPPYVGAPNPPDDAGGTSGILIREFWTRPHKTVKVTVPMFTASGEPACIPKMLEYEDGTSEPLRRCVTEGNVVYELPESIVDVLKSVESVGGIRILDDFDAWDVVTHKVDSLLYPDGRLLVIVDDAIKPEEGDTMNPLGYMPFIEINAHPESSSFYGMSDIDLIKDAYEALIRLVSLIFDNAMLAGNTVWRIPEESTLTNDDITNAPGAIQREDLITLKYGKREVAPEMPNYVMNLVRFYLEQIDDLAGLSPAILGKSNPKAQQSTDTTLMQTENSSVDFRDAQRELKRADTILGQQFQEFVERFYTEPELVEIKNELGQKEAVPIMGNHLTETFHVQAKPGSLMSSTPTARLTTAMNLIQTGQPLMDLPEIWRLLEEVELIVSAKEIEARITRERANPALKWLVPGADPKPPGGKGKKPNSKRAKAGATQGAG